MKDAQEHFTLAPTMQVNIVDKEGTVIKTVAINRKERRRLKIRKKL